MADPARHAIHELLLTYCDAADRADAAAVVACFTPEATVDFGPRLRASGRDQLVTLFDRFLGPTVATSHHLTNLQLHQTAGGTEATSYVMAWHLLPGDEQLFIVGRYLDTVVQTDEGWRIAHRRLEVHGAQGPPISFHRLVRTST